MTRVCCWIALLMIGAGAFASEASFDDRHNLIVDGRPTLVLGVCDVFSRSELEKAAALGFNTVEVPYRGMDKNYPNDRIGVNLKDYGEYLDEAHRLGLKVIPWFGGYDEDYIAKFTEVINEYKNHPAIIGWYVIDEPSNFKWDKSHLEEVYRQFKAADPAHILVSAFCSLPDDAQYVNTVDVFGIDPYPIRREGTPGGEPVHVVDETVLAFDVSGGKRPIWAFPQAFSEEHHWNRTPTAVEYRLLCYLPLMYGAKGLLAYTWRMPEAPKDLAIWSDPGLQEGAKRTNGELAQLSDVILNGERRNVSAGAVHAAIFAMPDGVWAMVANTRHEAVQPELVLPGETKRATDAFTGAAVSTDGGRLRVELAPYDVQVVRLTFGSALAPDAEWSLRGACGEAAPPRRK